MRAYVTSKWVGVDIKPGKEQRARERRRQMEAERKSIKCQVGLQEPSEPRGQRARVMLVGTEKATSGCINKSQAGSGGRGGADC